MTQRGKWDFPDGAIGVALIGAQPPGSGPGGCTQESVEIRGFHPSNLHDAIPYRDGSTKAQRMTGTAAFPHKLLGEQRFRAFSVRLEMILTGWAHSMHPARRFAFCEPGVPVQD